MSSGNGDPSTSASAVSLGKRTRSASPLEGSSKKNGHSQSTTAAGNDDEQANESSDDDNVGPMPMPEGAGDESDDEAGPMPAAGPAASKAVAKKRKVLKYEKVYLDNLPSADRYYSMFAASVDSCHR